MQAGNPPASFWVRAREFRRAYQAPEGLFWIKRVNHTLGALIAFVLLPTPVTPNALTVLGLGVQIVGATVTAFASAPASVSTVLVVALLWQLGFALDCADGPLARARHQTSAFGAWFDQLADSVGRTAIYIGLTIFLVRALAVEPIPAVVLGSIPIALALLQTFSSWQRAVLVGGSPIADAPAATTGLLRAAQQLVDYGAFLFLAAVVLLAPPLLLGLIVASAAVNALFVLAQLALGWRRQAHEKASGRPARTASGEAELSS